MGVDTENSSKQNVEQLDICKQPCGVNCHFKGKFLKQLTRFTVCKHQVPLLFHEPYVERGYRDVGKPWRYYLLSIFQLHNESMNIWSHILASILVLKKLQAFSKKLDFVDDPFAWPLLAGILSSLTLFILSCTAHCLQSRSPTAHHIAYMFDYAGVGLYALGSVVMFLEYSSTDNFFYATNYFFVYIGIPFSCAACIGCCLSKIIYERPYPFARKLWQIIPVGGVYILLISPVVHRIYLCLTFNECEYTFTMHVQHIICFLVSTFFFACQLPQSLAPAGACDHFFHSHQLFHLAIMISILIQLDAICIDFTIFNKRIRSHPEPTLLSAFGPIIFVGCFELLSIFFFYLILKRKLNSKSEIKIQ